MVAEAAHSWADTGNEILSDRRTNGRGFFGPAGPGHPLGYGREAYVWSLFAALGLFVAGAAVSMTPTESRAVRSGTWAITGTSV